MPKLNFLQYNMQNIHIKTSLSLHTLSNNDEFENLKINFLKAYGFEELNTFSFDKDGFLGLFLHLSKKGKIALCVGESDALVQAGKVFEELGFFIVWIGLERNGKVSYNDIKNNDFDFLFLSSYVMDTFVKTNLEEIKSLTNAKIISNASANFSKSSDAIYFDPYKLTGFSSAGVLLFKEELFDKKVFGFINSMAVSSVYESLKNQKFEKNMKDKFKAKLEEVFKDDLYYFVNPCDTFDFSLHFALKNIKARELIRTLALDDIFITNGEGCSLGLSRPSRIIQEMGYEEDISRNAISLSFMDKFSDEECEKIVKIIYKRYRQIKVLNEQ